ncbi:dnaJ protein ERDJ3A [Mercurialis annua]|uniref:dnaJ protein ERDJ3A n=1 Tax=Mercurialis annua TaxID=3986 RepID=UPI00215F2098|nr:dnaJ protein ERDJ3A [Mercurialis annua]
MNSRTVLIFFVLSLAVLLTEGAKTTDPYKVLGVDKSASQREIQKAFHKLSLQYHPDKNKSKGAQAKFAEINNAYEILSDEEKRKNYDLYGDEKGNPGFGAGYPGDQGGYTSYSQGSNGFNFRPNGWQNMGGQDGSSSYSFSFGGPSSQNSFGFDLNDIFSNFFGGDGGGSRFGGFGGSTKSHSSSSSGSGSSPKSFRPINSKTFKKEIADQGMTWLLLAYNPSLRGSHSHESIIQEVADSLQGALRVGSINCETEKSFCSELGIHLRQMPRVFVYSYKANEKGSLVEYNSDMVAKSLKTFCRDHLPRFSRRIDLKNLDGFSGSNEKLPRVLLLSTKKETPVIWRVLSGLYHKRFIFSDAQVHEVTDPMAKKLGIDELPAIVGWLSNGERRVLKSGISVIDLQSAVQDLSAILDGFEKKNKKTAFNEGRKQDDSLEKQIPLLTGVNFDALCGEKRPVCIIGAFRSSKAREKLESILTKVSEKPLLRQRNAASGSRDSISYALLDANRQQAFLNALDKSGLKSSDKLLLAYKPRKGRFATFTGEMTAENVEGFVSSVLNGDIQFTGTRQKPMVK